MDLSNDLISKFVKITNDGNKKETKEGTVYGTAVKYDGSIYVKIDGSDLLTPIDTTADIKEGERVTIMIKDHNATVTGNITSPSASSADVKKVTKNVEEIEGEITEFEAIIADVVHVGELDAEVARIDELIAGKATIEDLTATNAEITNLKAKDAEIENLVADKATIEDLTATNAEITNLKAKDAEIENLVADKATIEDLTATNAEITNLKANKADITYLDANFATIDELEATHANIDVLDAEVANINTLVNGNLTSDNILSFNITSKNTTMEDAFIKDAMIDRITANKIMSGTIDTNNVVIQSTDGSMLLQGNILQMKDESGKVRIQIGKDNGGNFTFVLYDETGKGVLIDEEGIKSSDAIADGLIVDAKVADNANISGSKLDIASVITEVNNDNSTTIKSSKIYLNEQNQSLEVAFNSLKTQVETIQDVTIDGDLSNIVEQVQSNTTKIEANKEGINTLVAENVIRTEEINDLEGELQQVNTTLSNKYASLEQNLDGFKTTVSSTYTTKAEFDNLKIGARNYVLNSGLTKNSNNFSFSSGVSRDTNKKTPNGNNSIYFNISGLTADNWRHGDQAIGNKLEIGKTYTIGANVFVPSSHGLDRGASLEIICWNSSGTRTGTFAVGINTSTVDKWQSLSQTFTVPANTIRYTLQVYVVRNGKLYAGDYSLVEGGKSIWTPAPEDVQANIDAVDGKFANYSTTTQMNSAINQKANEITSSVSSTYTTKTEFQNLAIGGTNLFLGGKFTTYPSYQTLSSQIGSKEVTVKWVSSYSGNLFTLSNNNFQPKGEYTVSGYIKVNNAIPSSKYFTECASTYGSNLKENYYDSSTGYFRITQSYLGNTVWIFHAYTTRKAGSTDTVTLSKLKFEKGSKATDWTPAPEDVQANIDAVDGKFANYSTTTQMNSAIQQKANEITSRVESTEVISTYLPNGKMLYTDPNFLSGYNGIIVYNNHGNGNVIHTRILNFTELGCPSSNVIQIKTIGTSSPDHGGFAWARQPSANKIYITHIKAWIPKGVRIVWASNAVGTGAESKWLTSTEGTGAWSDYIHYLKCGSTGTFVSTAYYYLENSTATVTPSSEHPLIWYLSYATLYDATLDDNRINDLTTRVSTAESKLTKDSLTTTIGSYYTTSSDVNNAITSKGYATTSQVQQTKNELTATFKENGGYNRVRNGAFLTGDLTHWSTWGSCTRVVENSTDSGLGKVVKITTTGTNQGIQQTITGLAINKKYTLSALVWASSGVGILQVYDGSAYPVTGTTITGAFEKISVPFTAKATSVIVYLGRSSAGSNGTYYYTGVMLEEGTTETPWSPHPDEVYSGITKIDKDGVKVSQSNYNGYTQMKADGFYVNNGSENVISVTKDGSYFKGKVVITSGSTVPTSVLSGTISSSQLNSTITSDISTAKSNASTAVSTANTASTNASNAVKTANTASTNASTAVSTANTANTNASNAVNTANTASTNASNAVKTANTASTNASTAVSTANTAKSTAETANSTANSVKSTVDSGKTNWNNAYNRVNEWAYGAVTGSTTIDGGYIQTNTILANKLAIGDFNNYCDLRYGFSSGVSWAPLNWNSNGYWNNDSTKQYMQLNQELATHAFNNNDSINFTFDFYTANSVTLYMGLWYYDSSLSYLGANYTSQIVSTLSTWHTISKNVTVSEMPTGTKYVRLLLDLNVTGYSVAIRNIKVFRRSGGELIVDGAITAAKIASRTITADRIASGVITANEIKSRTITADRIATGVITANEIAANAITAGKIAAGAITADKLAANAITSKTITGSTITGGTISGATITSETLMKTYGGMYVGSEIWGGFKKDSNGNYSSAQTFTIRGSTALQIDGNPTRISSVTGEVKIGDASSYDNLRAREIYAQEIIYTNDLRTRDAAQLSLSNVSMRSANAFIEFSSGYGVIRVKDRNHLYLQTKGNTGGDTSAEIRCTRYLDTSNYVNIRAYNVCAQNAVYANGVNVSSDINRKRDIELYSTDALHEVCSTPVYAYHLDTDKDEELKRIGIIMQEAPLDAIDLTGKGVDLYQMVTMLWRAVQQQQEIINELKGE